MISVLRNSGEQLTHSFFVDGVSTAADGAVTVQIVKGDGTDLVPAGTATTHGTAGAYSYVLAPQATLNLLTVTWTGTFGGVVMSQTDQVEIVGGVYVSLSEFAAMPQLASVAVADLANLRREFEDLAELYCGLSFVPRYDREYVTGRGTTTVMLAHPYPRVILSASSTDTAGTVTPFTVTNWQRLSYGAIVTDGDVLTSSTYGEPNLFVEYEHGLDGPPPGISKACKLWVRNQALQDRNSTGRDVLRQSDENGFSITYSTPDWDAGRPTGMMQVDAALNAVGRRAPAVA